MFCLQGATDHQLGHKIAGLITQQGGANFEASPILRQVQDLLGADTSLLGPLRDLLVRPGFRQLLGGESHSVLCGGRDALLQDLSLTYNHSIVERLAAVIDGILGLPPGPLPSLSGPTPSPAAAPGFGSDRAPGAGFASAMPGWSSQETPPTEPASIPAPAWSSAGVPPAPQVVSGSGGGGGNGLLVAVVIVLITLLTGAVGLAVGWFVLTSKTSPPSQPSSSQASPTPSAEPPQDSSSSQPPPTQPPSQPPAQASLPAGVWGDASQYKFGRLPGGDYPHSCAFSRTDPDGKITIDKTLVEYWACNDVGGDPDNGYTVVWADGKKTTYTFSTDGSGTVVGTNRISYPMRWRNDTHQGSEIIVISHEDGATSWIPGNIKS